jgi:hypothetical protein
MAPDFIIPGEAKCGTTSLYRYLSRHPDIVPADMKEPLNFITYGASPLFCRQHYPLLVRRWVRRGLGHKTLTGEASANYFAHPTAPDAIARTLPSVRIVVLLRHPVLRAFSDYQMMKTGGYEAVPFDQGVARCLAWLGDPDIKPLVDLARLADEGFPRYVLRGVYVGNLRRWRGLFSPDRILVLQSEAFFHDPQKTLDRVFAFLDLPPLRIGSFPVLKKGRYAGALTRETWTRLSDYYRPFNRELYALVGQDFGWDDPAAFPPPAD